MTDFIPFKQRASLWADLEPIDQYEGGAAPISPIAYSNEYKEVMGYFRAIYSREEVSERALALTAETIQLNQGNYTAWFYRRKLLFELHQDLGDEIVWLNRIGLEMQKNFQIWHHRRCIFEMWVRKAANTNQEEESKDNSEHQKTNQQRFDLEFQFLQSIFDGDAKNYHAWSHKIWLIERFELWTQPSHLEFAETMLDQDVRNNSVWSFRYFLINRTEAFSQELVERECRYVLEKRLPEDWMNEAAWAYLRGFLATTEKEATDSRSSNAKRWFIGDLKYLNELLDKWGKLAQAATFSPDMIEPIDGDDENEATSKANMRFDGLQQNRFLYATLVDSAIASGQKDKAHSLLDQLKKFDSMRSKFWEWRKTRI